MVKTGEITEPLLLLSVPPCGTDDTSSAIWLALKGPRPNGSDTTSGGGEGAAAPHQKDALKMLLLEDPPPLPPPRGLGAKVLLRAAAGLLCAAAAAAVLPAASPYSIQAEKLGYSVVEIGDSQ